MPVVCRLAPDEAQKLTDCDEGGSIPDVTPHNELASDALAGRYQEACDAIERALQAMDGEDDWQAICRSEVLPAVREFRMAATSLAWSSMGYQTPEPPVKKSWWMKWKERRGSQR